MNLKTFELIPVVDRVNPGGEKSKTCIECMEQVLENLYIGTSDCFLVHYSIEKGTNSTGKTIFVSRLQRNKQLGFRKPVKQLVACPTIGQLLVLCDGNVFAVSMYGLEFLRGSGKELMRNINCMARNNKPPVFNHDETQICVGTRRKTIQILKLTSDDCLILKEFNVPESASLLAIDSYTICLALGNRYHLIDSRTSHLQELFTFEVQNSVIPIVKRIGSEEFLLNGPTDTMAMIVNSAGLSVHQPLTWSDGVCSVAFSYPYVLVLGKSTVTVHSILDQNQKQAMSFTGGVLLNDFEGQVFVAMQRSVLAFQPVPFKKQIQMLMIDKRVQEAFDLLVVSSKMNPKEYNDVYVKQVKAQAAFIYFENTNLDKALSLFLESSVDPREVIVLYPLMMPANKNFTPSRPLLHNIKDLTAIVKGSKTVFANAKKMLLNYLEKSRGKFVEVQEEIDTALVKLYAECNHPKLEELVSNDNAVFSEEAFSWLTQWKRYHALALYHRYLQQEKLSLEIWHKLANGEIEDSNFPGLSFVVDYLTSVSDMTLFWSNSSWVLKQNQELGVNIFIKRVEMDQRNLPKQSKIIPDQVCDFLQKFPAALQLYLEYIVYEKASISEKHHTHLALIYVEHVVNLLNKSIKDSNEVESARSKLQSLLETSSTYRISTVLQKISHYPLYKEIAILYGKMDQHDKALKILVYQLKDFEAAENYCDLISVDKTSLQKQRIFLTLLQTYLYPNEEESSLGKEHYVVPAVALLNKRHAEFNFLNVLEMLPDDWTIGSIDSFMSGSLRHTFSQTRSRRVESNLRKQMFLQTKTDQITRQHGVVNITEEKTCDFCKKSLTEPTVARYPNGVVVHLHCSKNNKSVCPVTGRKFK